MNFLLRSLFNGPNSVMQCSIIQKRSKLLFCFGSWSSNASLPINGLISFINLCFTLSKASRYWRNLDYKKWVIIFVTTHLKIKEQTGWYSAPLTSSISNKSSFADRKQCLIACCCCVNKKSIKIRTKDSHVALQIAGSLNLSVQNKNKKRRKNTELAERSMFSMSNNFCRMSTLLNLQALSSGACGKLNQLPVMNAQTNTNRDVNTVWIKLRQIHQKINDLAIILLQCACKSRMKLKIKWHNKIRFLPSKRTTNSHLCWGGKLRHLAQPLDRFQVFLFAFFAVYVISLNCGRDWICSDANAVLIEQVKYLWVSASCCFVQGVIIALFATICCKVQFHHDSKQATLSCVLLANGIKYFTASTSSLKHASLRLNCDGNNYYYSLVNAQLVNWSHLNWVALGLRGRTCPTLLLPHLDVVQTQHCTSLPLVADNSNGVWLESHLELN